MQQILTTVKDAYTAYSTMGINLALVWISIIYLYIHEENKQKRNFVYFILVMVLLVLNPFTANNIITFYMQNENYYPIFAIIPSAILVAYTMTKVVSVEKEKVTRRVLLGGFCIILLISVNCNFTTENIGMTDNKYRVLDEAQELQQVISSLGDVYVIAPREVGEQLRECDSSVRVLGGDDEKWGAINDISQNWSDSEKIKNYAAAYGVNCIICPKGDEEREKLDSESFLLLAETENYRVYVWA